jgi:hypothetical protein
MAERDPQGVTLSTLHEDLTTGFAEMRTGLEDLKGEMRSGFADVKTTLIAGFRNLSSRESSEEMVRLLREGNRLQEGRFTQFDLRSREQHLEVQQILHATVEGQRLLVEGQRSLVEGQRSLVEGQRSLVEGQRSLSADIKALIARLDALIRGRGDGSARGPDDSS